MSGRAEIEERTQDVIEDLLRYNPEYVGEFYKSLRNNSYNTQYAYVNHVVDFLIYLERELKLNILSMRTFDQMRPLVIENYLYSLDGVKDSTKERRYYSLRKFFKFLKKNRYIVHNPIEDVEKPKVNEEHAVTYLTRDEIKIVQNNILNGVGSDYAKEINEKWKKRDYALIMMGLVLGMRISSLLEIDLDDIDFENNTIAIIEKGNKKRSILVSDKLKDIILDWVEDRNKIMKSKNYESNALFISKRSPRLQRRGAYQLVKRYTYNLKKPISPHKLRSTCACLVYEETGDLLLTAHRLGHASTQSTKRYTCISKEREKKLLDITDTLI